MSEKILEFKDAMKLVKKITKLLDGLKLEETTAVITLTIKNLSYLSGTPIVPFVNIFIIALEHIKSTVESFKDTKGGPSVN